MSVARFRAWAVEQALPLWATTGFDEAQRQFVERIGFDGTPLLHAPRRVMVQARQIYVYGLAHREGWFPGGERLVERAYGELVRRYGDGTEGWAFSTDRDGAVVDPTRDLYAQAFVLLGLATVRQLGGGSEPLRLARQTLAFMDAHMATPAGGYVEAWPGAGGRRRQNPHMHLLEALLAWHALAPDAGFDRRAGAILDLLMRRFLVRRGEDAALVEYFDDDLNPLGGPDFTFEPGHHFEWVWLLDQAVQLTGRSCAVEADALWRSAIRHGFRADGCIIDEVTMSGRPCVQSVRLWPLTEALKACGSGRPTPPGGAARIRDGLAATLVDTFLLPAPSGLWFDHFDETGRLKNDNAPASSLYHLCCALSQLSGEG